MDGFNKNEGRKYQLNVLGEKLESCNCSKSMEKLINLTGCYRDGFCHTSEEDYGMHTVCCLMTKDFLIYTKNFSLNIFVVYRILLSSILFYFIYF